MPYTMSISPNWRSKLIKSKMAMNEILKMYESQITKTSQVGQKWA